MLGTYPVEGIAFDCIFKQIYHSSRLTFEHEGIDLLQIQSIVFPSLMDQWELG